MKHTILTAAAVFAFFGSPVAFAGKPASETTEIKCPECGKPLEVSLHTDNKTNTLSLKINKVGNSANPKN